MPSPFHADEVDSKSDVCIIGAGASGLASALRLRQKGYKDVVIFERNAVPGGKAITLHVGPDNSPVYLAAIFGECVFVALTQSSALFRRCCNSSIVLQSAAAGNKQGLRGAGFCIDYTETNKASGISCPGRQAARGLHPGLALEVSLPCFQQTLFP